MKRYKYITETATNAEGMNNRETVRFHYHNPNGLVARKCANDKKIRELIDAGKCKNGALFAHGAFSVYEVKQLIALNKYERVPRIDMLVAISMLEKAIQLQEDFIAKTEKR